MIRRRIVAAVSLVAAVAVLAGGWLVLFALEARLVDNLDRDFRQGRLSDELRDAVVAITGDGPRPRGGFDPVQSVAVVRYDPRGTIVGSLPSGPRADPDPLPDAAGVAPDDGLTTVGSAGPRFRVAAFATPTGGTVVVGVPMDTIDETLRDARRILVVFGVGAVATIASLSWVLTRRAMAPVEGMIATADRIAAGELSERTAVDDPGTEVGRLGAALDAMLDRIESAVDERAASEERMRRFVAEASHELRTPLTSVRGYAELYRRGADDPEAVATSMARIEAEAERMHRLVEDLLALARLDREAAPERRTVDLARVAGESVDAARVVDPTRTWDLDVRDPAGLGTTAEVDGDQVRRVVDNLLANARVHTPTGTTVTTTVRTAPDAVVVVVADDGPGIAPADADRVFDRFWRATRTDQNLVPGAGLGLAIVASIVGSHGGDVSLDASDAGGARVTVTLPRTPGPSAGD